MIWALRIWITIVDWVTPFSLLYLYKRIGGVNNEKSFTKNSKSDDSSVGVDKIKMLLERGESLKSSYPKTSLKSYTDVVDTKLKYSPQLRQPPKTPDGQQRLVANQDTLGTLNRDSDDMAFT